MNLIQPKVANWNEEQEETITSRSDDLQSFYNVSEGTNSSNELMPLKRLYPDKVISPYFTTAISLLDESVQKTNEAIEAITNNDWIGSDNAVLHTLSILPELFCCRSIGEGFATLINAIFHSIKNNGDDKLLTEKQLIVLKNTFIKLSNEPFMNFSDALDLVIKIEDTGLIIEPKHIKPLLDIVNE